MKTCKIWLLGKYCEIHGKWSKICGIKLWKNYMAYWKKSLKKIKKQKHSKKYKKIDICAPNLLTKTMLKPIHPKKLKKIRSDQTGFGALPLNSQLKLFKLLLNRTKSIEKSLENSQNIEIIKRLQ